MAQTTFSTTLDGWVEGTDTFYPPVADAVDATATYIENSKWFRTPNYSIWNGLYRFDTSALPDDATVTAATLSLRIDSHDDVDARSIVFEWYDPGATITTADYSSTVVSDAHSGTLLSTIPAAGTIKTFALQNLSNINLSGFTGLRSHITGGAPTGDNYMGNASLEHATSQEPRLIVDYTTSAPQFDAEIESVRTDTSDPMTWTHTPVGTPKGIVVAFVHGISSTDHVSTVTYGGVAMAEVIRRTDTVTEPGAAELWFLGSGIPTGAQTVSADLASGTTDDIHGISWSLTADADTEVIDSDGIAEDAANPTVALQKSGRLGWCVAAMYGGGAAPGGTLSAGNTLSHTHDLGAFYSQSCYETEVDTADHTIGWSTLASDDLAFVALCVVEVLTVGASLIYRPRPMIRNI